MSIQERIIMRKLFPMYLIPFQSPRALQQQGFGSWSSRKRRASWSHFFYLHVNCWSCTHGFKHQHPPINGVTKMGYKTLLNLDPFQQMATKYGRKQQKRKKPVPTLKSNWPHLPCCVNYILRLQRILWQALTKENYAKTTTTTKQTKQSMEVVAWGQELGSLGPQLGGHGTVAVCNLEDQEEESGNTQSKLASLLGYAMRSRLSIRPYHNI